MLNNNNNIIIIIIIIVIVVVVFRREMTCKRQNYVNENAEDENDWCLVR